MMSVPHCLYDFSIKGESPDACLPVQIDIINLLQQEKGHLSVVGDDHQSIYMFRGSIPSVFNDFINNYNHPDLRQNLTLNYR